eukprot:946357_1
MMIQYHFYQLVLSWNTSRCFVVLPVFTSTFIFSKSWISRRVFDRPTQQLIFESFSIQCDSNAISIIDHQSIQFRELVLPSTAYDMNQRGFISNKHPTIIPNKIVYESNPSSWA